MAAKRKEVDLRFEQVSKRYVVRHERTADETSHPLLQKLRALRSRSEDFWAVRDVSFAVERGEVLGIIGHNGAGKSTILKLLSSITAPTQGQITINGRLSALIEVGSGFHPELSGRENIFLNGAILGMRRDEIAAKLDSIVDFAGVRQFLDTPVKRFSSGMYVRLGFAIAAHLDPDILLLDEVLAVGDAAFQEKCLRRIAELRASGKTIVFISHDLAAVERICGRVILMSKGEIVMSGDPAAVIREYQSHANESSPAPTSGKTNSPITSTTLTFQDGSGLRTAFRTGSPLVAHLDYQSDVRLDDVVCEILLYTADRAGKCELSTGTLGQSISIPAGRGAIVFSCEELGLHPGLYYADVAIRGRDEYEAIHVHHQAAMLRVDPGKVSRGEFYQPHSWRLEPPGPLG